MLRGIAGVFAGVLAGGISVFVAESGAHMMWPPPEGLDVNDPVALKHIMSVVPLHAKLAVLFAWGMGTFIGCAMAIFVSNRASWPSWFTALILFGFALWTMTVIPHPDWMVIGATSVTLVSAIAAAYLWARS